MERTMVPLVCVLLLGFTGCDPKATDEAPPEAKPASSGPLGDPEPSEEVAPAPDELVAATDPAPNTIGADDSKPSAAEKVEPEPTEENEDDEPRNPLEPKTFDPSTYDTEAYDMWEFDELSDPRFVDDYPDASCTDGADCVAKGKEQFEVSGADKDRKLAFVYFRLGCLQDHGQSCFEQGRMFRMLGMGSHPFTKWAKASKIELFKKGCELGYGISCMDWGDQLEGSERTDAYAKSMSLLEKGCEDKVVKDCVWLASNLSDGRGGEKDEPRAAKLFKAMCEKKDAYACERYALALQEGEGVKKNLKSARKWLRKGCKIQPEYCGKLTGRIRLDGIEPSGG